MSDELLNENQRRRIATHLHLLQDDIDALGRLPALSEMDATFDHVRTLLREIVQKADDLRASLALGVPRIPSLQRRIGAVAEIWAVRMEDLMAGRLKSYGRVHPDLAGRLDHYVRELTALLQQLADAATALPER
jgi:hypothetical protein